MAPKEARVEALSASVSTAVLVTAPESDVSTGSVTVGSVASASVSSSVPEGTVSVPVSEAVSVPEALVSSTTGMVPKRGVPSLLRVTAIVPYLVCFPSERLEEPPLKA